MDFLVAKDNYRFISPSGQVCYLIGLFHLNIIILNLVIALVGDVYDRVMMSKKETELKLKAQMLKELYDFKSTFQKEKKEVGNIYCFRYVQKEHDEEW